MQLEVAPGRVFRTTLQAILDRIGSRWTRWGCLYLGGLPLRNNVYKNRFCQLRGGVHAECTMQAHAYLLSVNATTLIPKIIAGWPFEQWSDL